MLYLLFLIFATTPLFPARCYALFTFSSHTPPLHIYGSGSLTELGRYQRYWNLLNPVIINQLRVVRQNTCINREIINYFFFTMDGSLIPNKWLLPLLSNFSPWNSLFQAFRLEGRHRDVRTKISQGRPSHWTPGPCYTPKAKAMFTLDTFCADTIKIWIGILLTH